ncbi:MAG: low molecular weight protein tyrosine phosphatase family protein [Flavobacteriales bacterium]
MNILFICSRNNWRSPTAEAVYKDRAGIAVKSAGTGPSARIRVTAKLIDWADVVFVMEKKHKQRLTDNFLENIGNKPIVILDIPDEYKYMDTELIESIETSVSAYLDKT